MREELQRYYLRFENGAWRIYRLKRGYRRPAADQTPAAGALHLRGACNWVRLECGLPPVARHHSQVPHHG